MQKKSNKSLSRIPDVRGYYGSFGGRFIPETLMAAVEDLKKYYFDARRNKNFRRELEYYLREYAGRPTPLTEAKRFARAIGAGRVFLKREDLAHTGSHKINNTLGQALLALRMGKKRVIAETGAGQHGVATATVAALFGLSCDIYMGEEDVHRQSLNVFRMRLLGARVIPVKSGSQTLKDSINEAMRDWVTNSATTHYIIGTVMGPHPYPTMVCDFQSVIGRESISQMKRLKCQGPDYLVACVGGGSNSIGLFHPYIGSRTKMIGVEAAGLGLKTKKHAATLTRGGIGVFHGMKSRVLETNDGQIKIAHSLSAGLDYPGVGPEHAYLQSIGRAAYVSATDKDALMGMRALSRLEGIIPALESSHALGYLLKHKNRFKKTDKLIICLSGRGDKDMDQVSRIMDLR